MQEQCVKKCQQYPIKQLEFKKGLTAFLFNKANVQMLTLLVTTNWKHHHLQRWHAWHTSATLANCIIYSLQILQQAHPHHQ